MEELTLNKGRCLLEALSPGQPEALESALAGIAPDMAAFVMGFGYGEVLSRPGLDLKSRQTATVAALAALGTAPAQLAFHAKVALGVGVTSGELVEILYLVALFRGFPAALNALGCLAEIFEASGVRPDTAAHPTPPGDRRERGLAALEATSGESGRTVLASIERIAPDLAAFLVDFAYGDVIARPALDTKLKEIAMIAAAAAPGGMLPQLKVHIAAGLKVGLSRQEIVEVLIQMAVYAGFPAALNALFAAGEVLDGA